LSADEAGQLGGGKRRGGGKKGKSGTSSPSPSFSGERAVEKEREKKRKEGRGGGTLPKKEVERGGNGGLPLRYTSSTGLSRGGEKERKGGKGEPAPRHAPPP